MPEGTAERKVGKMTSDRLICRKYHDGKFYDDIRKAVWYDENVPEYTLFRNIPDCFDTVTTVTYTLVSRYTDGSVNQWLFDDIGSAFRVFRRLSIGWTPVV